MWIYAYSLSTVRGLSSICLALEGQCQSFTTPALTTYQVLVSFLQRNPISSPAASGAKLNPACNQLEDSNCVLDSKRLWDCSAPFCQVAFKFRLRTGKLLSFCTSRQISVQRTHQGDKGVWFRRLPLWLDVVSQSPKFFKHDELHTASAMRQFSLG